MKEREENCPDKVNVVSLSILGVVIKKNEGQTSKAYKIVYYS